MPHFPKSYEVGANCELILWMTKFKGKGEGNGDIEHWNLRAIYTRSLLSRGLQEGLLDMIEDRVSEAHQAKNSYNNNYITMAKRDGIKKAIADFRQDASDADKALSMTDLFVQGIWHDPTAAAPTTPLGILLKGLYDADLYFPSNHPGGDLDAIKALVDPATAKTLLWNFPFPDPVTLDVRTLGDMTMEKVFQSELKYLATYFKPTFDAIRSARANGILLAKKNMMGKPDSNSVISGGPSIKTGPNGKCCRNGICDTGLPGQYCKSTTGNPGDPCNSMSDSCG